MINFENLRPTKAETKSIVVNVEPDLAAQFTEICTLNNVKKSAVVRQLLTDFIASQSNYAD